ncbi:MAG TPA: thioesterase family protein [Candidatus Acidoferrales bacterium]|nr:thioesterase family protein [Candidatus Acidoferrales bacterium]
MLTNRRRIRIQFGDCDPHGTVFYPRNFEFFDACTDALFERAGLPREKLLRTYRMDGIPLVDVRTSFLRPSRYGDTVAIESSFAECGRSSFSVCHKLYNGKVLAVDGVGKRVWVVPSKRIPSRFKSQAIPQEIVERCCGLRDRRQASGKARNARFRKAERKHANGKAVEQADA